MLMYNRYIVLHADTAILIWHILVDFATVTVRTFGKRAESVRGWIFPLEMLVTLDCVEAHCIPLCF